MVALSTATTGTGRRSGHDSLPADDESRMQRWRRRLHLGGKSTAAAETGAKADGRDRRRGRQRRETPRRWPWIVALGLVAVVICAAVYAVFFSPLLGLKTVSITGVPDAVAAKIRTVTPTPDGTALARIDLDAVAANVESVPEVAEVEVARGWPDTLNVVVTPRVPVAVTAANGRLWLLDSTGDPYLAVGAAPPGLVTVQLVAPGAGDPSTAAALAVASALTPEFRATVAAISARTPFDVEVDLTDGRKVVWGAPDGSAQKMQILPALLAAQEGTLYYITDPTLVTVR